ncbi:phospholipid carrier-dependent glycosyltransferase [Phormidium pseudopriestleyi FRX01]|uniref:Phospholipid carrier-dependent glycosyltransferase n=1 Tax=Phormidium pseudopriestleyi FRX01 TaxID=1759528 RepID=A0ABS3FLL3_9CYAN|nr:phospholipid carrier-dependent glycosyltransferase [Phormidium pseudopriestleyi FRX01]
MKNYQKHHGWLPIAGLWLLGAFCDRLWFALDRSIPSWDQADYLTGALNYGQALQTPQWFSGEWWRSLWLLSSKMPPGTYIMTAFFHNLFGIEADHATLVYLFFSAILLPSVYGLGRLLFNPQIGVWAAALCLMFPGLYHARLDFLLDFPLTALVTFSFYSLTLWKVTEPLELASLPSKNLPRHDRSFFLKSPACQAWFWAIVLGLSVGLSLMIKQTALFFLITPIVWVIVSTIKDRRWVRCLQLMVAALVTGLVMYPWYRTNWLLVFTGSQRAAIQAAVAEGDPAIYTLPAWTFYAEQLPHHVSWPFLVVPVVGFMFYWWRSRGDRHLTELTADLENPVWKSHFNSPFKWLAVFWIGSYVFFSLILNKDFRYVFPYLPVVSLVLAYGLMLFPRNWGKWVRWGTCSAALVLILADVWPVYEWHPDIVASHHAYRGLDWPHREAIAEIMETSPYLRSTLGVLPSTPMINQHNLNYYGNLQQFQVYGRQVGTRRSHVSQDARSLDWFLTKTGNQGSVPTEAQGAIVALVETGGEFDLAASWPLPDESTLNLYHHRLPMVTVEAVEASATEGMITLDRVTVPPESPPGVPIPVSYEWTGDWDLLRDGVVVLTWQLQSPAASTSLRDSWLHDHGIGKGELQAMTAPLQAKVIERMAMLPPGDVASGTYTLAATYLNRKTGETQGIEVPTVAIAINPAATATPAPELDWITQLRSLSAALPQGPKALEFIFNEMGRVNQYDPIQDYLIQAEKALEYRLKQEPDNVELAYNLAFSQVLQQNVKGSISAFERVVQLDSENPYAYAYLGFVNLYGWHPRQAEPAIKRALELGPDGIEVQLLYGISALMQGNIFATWSRLREFIPPLGQFLVLLIGWIILFLFAVIFIVIWVRYRKIVGKIVQ